MRLVPVGILLLVSALAAGNSPAFSATAPDDAALVCPATVVQGYPVTVSVLSRGEAVPGVTIEAEGHAANTDAQGRAVFMVPANSKSFSLKMQRGNNPVFVRPSVAVHAGNEDQIPQITDVLESLQPNHLATISGASFRGIADDDTVEVKQLEQETKTAAVVAASPTQLVVRMPELPAGKTTIDVKTVTGSSAPAPVDVVSVGFNFNKAKLSKGAREKIDVVVAGTDKETVVRIRNRTPDIVKLLPSADFFITTSGGKHNKAVFPVLVQQDGEFDVEASLVSVGGRTFKELPIANLKN